MRVQCFTAEEGDRFGEMSGSSEACSCSRSSSCATRKKQASPAGCDRPWVLSEFVNRLVQEASSDDISTMFRSFGRGARVVVGDVVGWASSSQSATSMSTGNG